MSYHNTSQVRTQDGVICRTVFGFLTAPLVVLTMVGTIIAL
jgi:hypothetical protein